jgi:hypothetical protein
MKKDLQQCVTAAQLKIREALQEFHNQTGMIPTSVEFTMVDVTTSEDFGEGLSVAIVGECYLHAQI